MSVAYFLAHRIRFRKSSDAQRVTPPAVRIAIAGIAVGLVVMILTVAIVVGFKQEIRDKIADFGGHLQIVALTSGKGFDKQPICYGDSLLTSIKGIEYVASVEPFITKPSVIKTSNDFLSVVMKSQEGLDEREISISESIARKLHLKIGDKVQAFFVQNSAAEGALSYGNAEASVKARTLTVVSLYQTHFSQCDDQMVLANFGMLQQLGAWEEDMVSGLQIRVNDFDQLYEAYDALTDQVSWTQDRRGTQYCVQNIEQQNPQIFGWLELLDTNVWVILSLMVVVAAFTMISGLLIIILEKAQMIALLKALGCNNDQLQRTFLYVAMFLVLQGLFWGDIIGVGLCVVQSVWHPLTLNPENYYLEWVPISITGWQILTLNVGALVITMLMLVVPSTLVSRISPGKMLAGE